MIAVGAKKEEKYQYADQKTGPDDPGLKGEIKHIGEYGEAYSNEAEYYSIIQSLFPDRSFRFHFFRIFKFENKYTLFVDIEAFKEY
jgi:hypothetical protein